MKLRRLLLICFFAALLVTVRSEDNEDDGDDTEVNDEEESDNNEEEEQPDNDSPDNSAPEADEDEEFKYPEGKEPDYAPVVPAHDVLFVETFQTEPFTSERWVKSHVSRYLDQDWRWGYGKVEPAIPGDKGIFYGSANKHYASGSFFPQPINNTDKTLVIQYEARLMDGLDCGGGYVKILSTNLTDLRKFGSNSPYIIMFGPDKCQPDKDKIHLIIRYKNKLSGKYQEKHLDEPPKVPGDNKTHLYTLVIRKDNTYSISIDDEPVKDGSLFTDFTPPFQPPKYIDDPSDTKPADWDDNEEIPDPNEKKPDDWDDNAPEMIPDPDAVKPDDWLEDEPEYIKDESATQPDDWDEEADGKWEQPEIPNPRCEDVSGCGPWKPNEIENPDYRGKWEATMIKNPHFQGKWKPRQIPNEFYYEEKQPYKFPLLGGIGIEIWTTSKNILFDNILITSDENVAREFGDNTYARKVDKEYVSELEQFVNKRRAERPKNLKGAQLHLENFLDFAIVHPFVATVVPTVIFGFIEFLIENFLCPCWCKSKKDDDDEDDEDDSSDEEEDKQKKD